MPDEGVTNPVYVNGKMVIMKVHPLPKALRHLHWLTPVLSQAFPLPR